MQRTTQVEANLIHPTSVCKSTCVFTIVSYTPKVVIYDEAKILARNNGVSKSDAISDKGKPRLW